MDELVDVRVLTEGGLNGKLSPAIKHKFLKM